MLDRSSNSKIVGLFVSNENNEHPAGRCRYIFRLTAVCRPAPDVVNLRTPSIHDYAFICRCVVLQHQGALQSAKRMTRMMQAALNESVILGDRRS